MAWAYADNEGYVPRKKCSNHRPLYRVWNGKRHRYTTSRKQYDKWGGKGAHKEGVAAWIGKRALRGYVPLFRLVEQDSGDVLLTTRAETCAEGLTGNYRDIEVFGYVSAEPRKGYRPLYLHP